METSESSSPSPGGTLFTRARNTERHTSIKNLYLKFEGSNPTGTQKDRVAFAMVDEARAKGFSYITAGTCGNLGSALAFACSLDGVRAIVFIPEKYHTRRVAEMERFGTKVVRVRGDYEAAVEESRREAERQGWYDANPGGENSPTSFEAYSHIAEEILHDLGRVPYSVAVPVSNGTTLVGIYRGFQRLVDEGRVDRLPRMIAASTYQKNPIVKTYKLGLKEVRDLSPEEIHETPVNEPLVNWHSYDGQAALDALYASSGWGEDVSDEAMLHYAKLLREVEGLNVLPASASALAAVVKVHRTAGLPEDEPHVVVLTGRR